MNELEWVHPIRLTFRYAERDFARAMRAHFASRLRLKLDIIVIGLVAGIGIYLWRDGGLRWMGVTLSALSGVFGLILLLAFFVMPRIVFRRNPKYRDEYELVFSTEGIHFCTVHLNSQLEWSLYTHVLIDPSSSSCSTAPGHLA
jgi:hypothetical protein